jgi:tRNA pseudouridine-54 N-methylase
MCERFQRHFLIPFSTVPSRASKAFDGRSRADVMCRCIVNSLMISANTRNDTCIACVLLGTPDLEALTLLCCGQHMRALHPTEKTVAGVLQVGMAQQPTFQHPVDGNISSFVLAFDSGRLVIC